MLKVPAVALKVSIGKKLNPKTEIALAFTDGLRQVAEIAVLE
jgi:hypothetical protein